jgi:hypothetical protein
MLFCKQYFSPLNNFMRKGKDPDPLIGGSGSWRHKNTRILRIRIPNIATNT